MEADLLPRRTVLVVDPLDETHEVLRTALSDRGVDVLGTHDSARGLALARQHRPHLIVLDVEADSSSPELAGRFASEAADTRLVILGTAKRAAHHPDGCQFLSKPYHYAPLIRKIEELLAA
jgi:DNA-binding response OmpR family regulator